ncbi:High-affinity branched-chain amino acid transport ATP-binding protein BraG [uncultured delta proteobacterium]|uniref:High-affinity branched-chain amino acid transport ATP-binding protein BraG n=1 Tax=uncultured delta proteobacterium TaxID=34034 RepID=A0A212K519_9DELT|nr:High-affinity branched-chain amino acid transport ATP-binding protein BraG [uncultured delta proteobacterium]
MLKIENLRVAYGDITVLRGLTLEVGKGELVALVGSNNAGKSTALKAIAGLIPTLGGTITVDGQDVTHMPAHKRAELGLTLIPEAWQLFGSMTVAENLMMGAFLHRKEAEKNKKTMEELLELFPALKDKLGRKANNLSGGERQMVSMCRALMTRPRLLLIDEPSMGLAPVIVDQIFTIIKKLNEQQFSILLVEQNLQLALTAANRGYVLEHGVIAMHDTGDALLSDSKVREKYLGI